LLSLGREPKNPRTPVISIDNIYALRNVIEKGAGIGVLPNYVIAEESPLSKLELGAEMPVFDCWLAYPEEMKHVARLMAFRDFLVANATLWHEK
jgi:DNA-binding transcriptional LysR family regulator